MTDSGESVVQAFIRAINRQDVEALDGLMTEEHRFVDSLGGVTEGREKMRAAWAGYFRMVPDYTIAVEETYCDIGNAGPSTPHPSDEDLSPGTPVPSAAADSAQDDNIFLRSTHDDSLFLSSAQGVVVILGVAQGTYSVDGELKPENRWKTPAALRAFIEDGKVAEWRVYADNEPIRQRMRESRGDTV
jgi:limonene-1,2-epoxide hydrolase